MVKLKYLDTYALVEISKGNNKFLKYLSLDFNINELTLAEFYGVILREYDEKTAEYWKIKLLPYTKSVNFDTIINAIKFKVKNKKMSFFDCVGYVFAVEHDCVFVTGDNDFVNTKNVEFVKK